MKQFVLSDDMKPLLGKAVISHISNLDLFIDNDKIRITDYILFRRLKKTPALIYNVSFLNKKEWGQLIRLLNEKKIGIVLSEYSAEEMYTITGRKMDGLLIYGDEKFWKFINGELKKQTAEIDREPMSVYYAFAGNIAGLRLFYGKDNILNEIKEYKRGKISKTEYNDAILYSIASVSVYDAFPLPYEIWEHIENFVFQMNTALINKIGGGAAKILELEEPPDVRVKISILNERGVNLVNALKIMHPRAIEQETEKTVYAKYLF